jgi:hypothetical protein
MARAGHNPFIYQMIMVGHEAVGVAQPFHPLADFTQDIEEGFSVSILQVNIRPAITAGGT